MENNEEVSVSGRVTRSRVRRLSVEPESNSRPGTPVLTGSKLSAINESDAPTPLRRATRRNSMSGAAAKTPAKTRMAAQVATPDLTETPTAKKGRRSRATTPEVVTTPKRATRARSLSLDEIEEMPSKVTLKEPSVGVVLEEEDVSEYPSPQKQIGKRVTRSQSKSPLEESALQLPKRKTKAKAATPEGKVKINAEENSEVEKSAEAKTDDKEEETIIDLDSEWAGPMEGEKPEVLVKAKEENTSPVAQIQESVKEDKPVVETIDSDNDVVEESKIMDSPMSETDKAIKLNLSDTAISICDSDEEREKEEEIARKKKMQASVIVLDETCMEKVDTAEVEEDFVLNVTQEPEGEPVVSEVNAISEEMVKMPEDDKHQESTEDESKLNKSLVTFKDDEPAIQKESVKETSIKESIMEDTANMSAAKEMMVDDVVTATKEQPVENSVNLQLEKEDSNVEPEKSEEFDSSPKESSVNKTHPEISDVMVLDSLSPASLDKLKVKSKLSLSLTEQKESKEVRIAVDESPAADADKAEEKTDLDLDASVVKEVPDSSASRSVCFDKSLTEDAAKNAFPKTPFPNKKSRSYIDAESCIDEADSSGIYSEPRNSDENDFIIKKSSFLADNDTPLKKPPSSKKLQSSTPFVSEKYNIDDDQDKDEDVDDGMQSAEKNSSIAKAEMTPGQQEEEEVTKVYNKDTWSSGVSGRANIDSKLDAFDEDNKEKSEVVVVEQKPKKKRSSKAKNLNFTVNEEEDEMSNSEEEDEEDERDEDEKPYRKNRFIEYEAMEVEDYESGDSMDSEEREELEMNEIPVDGESIGSEDTDEEDGSDDENSRDSFIVSDAEEDDQLLEYSDEEDSENAEEESQTNKKKYRRILSNQLEDSEESNEANITDVIRANSNLDKSKTEEKREGSVSKGDSALNEVSDKVSDGSFNAGKAETSVASNASKLSESAINLCYTVDEVDEDAEEAKDSSILDASRKSILKRLNKSECFNKTHSELDANPQDTSGEEENIKKESVESNDSDTAKKTKETEQQITDEIKSPIKDSNAAEKTRDLNKTKEDLNADTDSNDVAADEAASPEAPQELDEVEEYESATETNEGDEQMEEPSDGAEFSDAAEDNTQLESHRKGKSFMAEIKKSLNENALARLKLEKKSSNKLLSMSLRHDALKKDVVDSKFNRSHPSIAFHIADELKDLKQEENSDLVMENASNASESSKDENEEVEEAEAAEEGESDYSENNEESDEEANENQNEDKLNISKKKYSLSQQAVADSTQNNLKVNVPNNNEADEIELEKLEHLRRMFNPLSKTRRQSLNVPSTMSQEEMSSIRKMKRLHRQSFGIPNADDFNPSQSLIETLERHKKPASPIILSSKRKRLSKSFNEVESIDSPTFEGGDEAVKHTNKKSKLALNEPSSDEETETEEQANEDPEEESADEEKEPNKVEAEHDDSDAAEGAKEEDTVKHNKVLPKCSTPHPKRENNPLDNTYERVMRRCQEILAAKKISTHDLVKKIKPNKAPKRLNNNKKSRKIEMRSENEFETKKCALKSRKNQSKQEMQPPQRSGKNVQQSKRTATVTSPPSDQENRPRLMKSKIGTFVEAPLTPKKTKKLDPIEVFENPSGMVKVYPATPVKKIVGGFMEEPTTPKTFSIQRRAEYMMSGYQDTPPEYQKKKKRHYQATDTDSSFEEQTVRQQFSNFEKFMPESIHRSVARKAGTEVLLAKTSSYDFASNRKTKAKQPDIVFNEKALKFKLSSAPGSQAQRVPSNEVLNIRKRQLANKKF